MKERCKGLSRGALPLLAAFVIVPAGAQEYPAKAVRFVVSYAAGGGTDLTARPIAQKLTERWGKPMVVENRSGASGMIGADIVAKSAPDGYTVLVGAAMEMSTNLVAYKNMSYDPVKDFQPVTLASISPLVFMTHPSLPVKSVKELVALARAKPGALSYASIGIGTVHHFAGEYMKSTLKLDMMHVAYKGGAPALIGLVGGEVPAGFVALLSAIPNVRAGKLRALALTSLQRVSALPEVPTMNESGLSGFDIVVWFAAWVPAKTPRDIVDRLNTEMVRIIKSPEYRQRMIEAGAEAAGSSAEQLAQLQRAEIEKYRKIAVAAGIQPQ
ncbi:MAG: tripartite tricarboxylate transporter substrate binding protein [Burkholderiales bacterium]|nr:tripartite tricarboxylate transporter substrate binding protein [Burkholderiales bacterium]